MMFEKNVSAIVSNWGEVYNFLKECMIKSKLDKNLIMQLLLACEEAFVNISHYAYSQGNGKVLIIFEQSIETQVVKVHFIDFGIPFNPTKFADPDLKDGIDKRKIGGLGIHLMRKIADKMEYLYEDGKNKLIIIKFLK